MVFGSVKWVLDKSFSYSLLFSFLLIQTIILNFVPFNIFSLYLPTSPILFSLILSSGFAYLYFGPNTEREKGILLIYLLGVIAFLGFIIVGKFEDVLFYNLPFFAIFILILVVPGLPTYFYFRPLKNSERNILFLSIGCTITSFILLLHVLKPTRILEVMGDILGVATWVKTSLTIIILTSPILLIIIFIFTIIYSGEANDKQGETSFSNLPGFIEYSIKLITLLILILPIFFSGVYIAQGPVSDPYDWGPQTRFDFIQHPENQTITVIHRGGDTINNENDVIYPAVYITDSEKEYRFNGSEFSAGDKIVVPYNEEDIGEIITVVIKYPSPDDNIFLSEYKIKNITDKPKLIR